MSGILLVLPLMDVPSIKTGQHMYYRTVPKYLWYGFRVGYPELEHRANSFKNLTPNYIPL